MNRKEELQNLIKGEPELQPLVEEVLFLEERLTELRKLPFIKVNPQNQTQQKATPAAKQYKELLQQYTNCIKVLSHSCNAESGDEESPLRKWIKQHVNS